MIKYELYLAGNLADIDEKISVQITKAVDDVSSFATRNTSFSKVIVLPGTATNNALLGHIHELGSSNLYSPGSVNIGSVFNVAQTTKAELRLNGLLVLRGVFRLIKIVKNKSQIEYEGALFGDLGGFISAIGNSKLENLDFSAYDHIYNTTNIANSWDTINGSSYYYPLIDYGTYSPIATKLNYDIRTFRPAIYVKEYLDKIFSAAGYTYTSSFFDTAFFKTLIIPHNTKQLTKISSRLLTALLSGGSISTSSTSFAVSFDSAIGGNFTINGGINLFTYNSTSVNVRILINFSANYTATEPFDIILTKNGVEVDGFSFASSLTGDVINFTIDYSGNLTTADALRVSIRNDFGGTINITGITSSFTVDASPATVTLVGVGDTVQINDTIPKGIFQKDFFASILKMFNLYVDEDKQNEKNLLIKPYVNYYQSTQTDWSYKVDISKPFDIAPMGNLNGRFFEYKYKPDNDFYNEGYQKKYNQGYGDRFFDTGFQFSKDKQTTELIFAASPLVQYTGTDKFVTAIYKKSQGTAINQEELAESVIRILIAKKITGVTSWGLRDGVTTLASYTSYGYAGHLNDPLTPTVDINFGAPFEIFFTPTSYTSANLFNEYWSAYIAEIADKDSKLLSCYVYLTPLEFSVLDLSIPVFIDGVKWRINKLSDYDATNNELVRVELLKIINNG